jgi:hypothetical protein
LEPTIAGERQVARFEMTVVALATLSEPGFAGGGVTDSHDESPKRVDVAYPNIK